MSGKLSPCAKCKEKKTACPLQGKKFSSRELQQLQPIIVEEGEEEQIPTDSTSTSVPSNWSPSFDTFPPNDGDNNAVFQFALPVDQQAWENQNWPPTVSLFGTYKPVHPDLIADIRQRILEYSPAELIFPRPLQRFLSPHHHTST